MHFPEKKDNPYGAWAWRFDLKDTRTTMTKGLLAGKKVALKDNISVKDVPMLVGTDYFKDFVPVNLFNETLRFPQPWTNQRILEHRRYCCDAHP